MSNIIVFENKIAKYDNCPDIYFINENLSIKDISNFFSVRDLKKIKFYLSKLNKNKRKERIIDFDLSEKKKIIFIIIKKSLVSFDLEQLGARLFSFLKKADVYKVNLFCASFKKSSNSKTGQNDKNILDFIHGANLKSYSFKKYRTKLPDNFKLKIKVISPEYKILSKKYFRYKAIEEGVDLTRNLVSEPPNILHPKHYVETIKKLSSLGLKISIYDENKMKKMGMNALLGVGQGSINKSYLVTIEWNGNKNSKEKPLAFVGKGVCFDTGGISLKPAKFMEEMKYDMAGSAVVVGLLKTLALRKVKLNVVGVVGLVENMPGGNAQRPGDIVKSYSGQTIEVLNTDAEGRLVLADALTFTEKEFKPKFIIDLATLTGAIIVSLGEEYAGLFSNNDDLSNKIFQSGNKVGEKVWRLPLHKNYNKLMDSTVADVQNINYSGGAGSITAAEFLQRFIINKTPWVHLDIAGMAFSKKAANLNPSGATGFGVRLLNKLIEDSYE